MHDPLQALLKMCGEEGSNFSVKILSKSLLFAYNSILFARINLTKLATAWAFFDSVYKMESHEKCLTWHTRALGQEKVVGLQQAWLSACQAAGSWNVDGIVNISVKRDNFHFILAKNIQLVTSDPTVF